MNCPNCNFELYDSKFCHNCKTDPIITTKILNISIRYYNIGLENAKDRNFSGAISNLTKSIYFDKYNTHSRNLLGLVYFKVGHLADGVKQWIISSNINPDDNVANQYIETFSIKIRDFQKMNDSVKLYNESIEFMKSGNEDLSIIRLKKSLDINPDFIDAWNLLALFYIKEGKKDKALNCVKKVYKLDPYNPKINYYLKILDAKIFGMNRKINKKENSKNIIVRYLGYLISLILGLLIMFCAYKFMIVPDIVSSLETDMSALNEKYMAVQKGFNDLKESENTQVIELEKQKADLVAELEKRNKEISIMKNRDSLDSVVELYNNNFIQDAIKVFNLIDSTGFDSAGLELYNDIKAKLISSQ